MEGLSTRPVFDITYWHVGEVVKITIEPLAKRKEEFAYALFSLFVASAAIFTAIMIILELK